MAILDIFKRKSVAQNEANTVLGQLQLGNQVIYGTANKGQTAQQLLYVTTSSTTVAGRVLDISALTRNSTVMACVGAKARALAQCSLSIMSKQDDGTFVDALRDESVGARDKAKAKQVLNLLQNPNNFQNQYEFWYQWCMWQDITGESFTLWWRKDQKDPNLTPIEMYNLDSTLITVVLTPTRYPQYRLSTPSYGFSKDEPLDYHQVMHLKEAAWQGSSGFNKGILASELVALDQDIDIYANFIMQNGAKPSGMFTTDQVIPDAKSTATKAMLHAKRTGGKSNLGAALQIEMALDEAKRFEEQLKMLFMQAGRIDVWNATKARQAEMDRDDAKEMAALHAEEKRRKEAEAEQMQWAVAIVIIVMFIGAVGWGINEVSDLCARSRCGR